MTIDFPTENLVDGQYFPELGRAQPDQLQYQYDLASNSWNLIGPDNIATIDYVDGLIGDDVRNIRRNYDLHQATNSVTARFTQNFNFVTLCNNNAISSLNTELTTIGSNDLPAGQLNDLNEVISTGYSIQEWFECVSGATSPGDFSFLSVAINGFISTKSLKNGVALYFNSTYIDEGDSYELNSDSFAVGSILELKRDTNNDSHPSGFADDAYGVYRIIRVEEILVGASSTVAGYGLGLEFLYSHNINYNDDVINVGAPSTFVVYAKSLDRDGGTINGPLNIIYDDENTFTVSRTDEIETMVLKVDTTNSLITTNDEYNTRLKTSGDQIDILKGLATVDYVNNRVGLGSSYLAELNGPYLRLAGGTVTGKVVFDQLSVDNVEGFTIMSNPGTGSRIPTFYLKTAGDGDRIEYRGKGDDTYEILNKSQIESKITTETNKYVKKSGDTLSKSARISLSSTDDNDTFTDRNLVTWGKVKDITVAMVRDGSPQNPGELYEKGGFLYYRGYS